MKPLACLLVSVLMIGCGADERNTGTVDPPGATAADASSSSAGSSLSDAASAQPSTAPDGVVLFVGTSLTAGLGVVERDAYPQLIQEKIDDEGLPFRVVNAGVSGETSAGALARIDWLLRQDFDVFVLETGANDMLRGVDPDAVGDNIQAIIDRVRAAQPEAHIVLAGMLALPNLGPEYGERFSDLYVRLARDNETTLIPFILEGVAAEAALNQGDGIHPNPEGHRQIAETVWEYLEPVLEAASGGPVQVL